MKKLTSYLDANINEASGSFGLPNKMLILVKKDISKQLADLFNLYFSSHSFQSVLKTAKAVPVLKWGSELDCCNHRFIFLLSNM